MKRACVLCLSASVVLVAIGCKSGGKPSSDATAGTERNTPRGSGPKVNSVPSAAGPVIEANSLSFKASPAINTVLRPWSRIWRRIRPASVW